jgi:hypothetical protein
LYAALAKRKATTDKPHAATQPALRFFGIETPANPATKVRVATAVGHRTRCALRWAKGELENEPEPSEEALK